MNFLRFYFVSSAVVMEGYKNPKSRHFTFGVLYCKLFYFNLLFGLGKIYKFLKFYKFFTNSLNLLPRSAKFLKASKLALAGESKTTSPTFAFFLAKVMASSKFFT